MRRVAAALLVGLALQHCALVRAAIFTGLGDISGGAVSSESFAISADGTVVVGRSSTFDGSEAFRWTFPGGMVGLGHLADSNHFDVGYAVSADGSVIGGYGGRQAFLWTQATGMQASYGTFANAISANGSAIAGIIDNNGVHTAFGPNGNIGSGDAWGISADGSKVVGNTQANMAYYWTQGTGVVNIGSGVANAISGDGSTIVGVSPATVNGQAFMWTASSGMVGLGGLPGALYSESYAVSMHGEVIVGRSGSPLPGGFSPSVFTATIWDSAHGERSLKDVLTSDYGLNLSGWTLSEARGVSADGLTITGNGINPNGQREAWVARLDAPVAPVPEPASLVIWGGIGIAGLVAGWRRKRVQASSPAGTVRTDESLTTAN